jgi:hypothetical protein
MRLSLIATAALASLALAPLSAGAKVLAEGKPTPGGFYWQKVEKRNKSIQYMCRSKKESGIQKEAQWHGAKAAKP